MRKALIASTIATAALAVASCSNPDSHDDSATSAAATTAVSSAAASASASSSASAGSAVPAAEAGLEFTDGVVRAMDADSDMTAIFGTLTNTTDKDITITGFSTNVKASMEQIHEVVEGVMQEKEGGLKVPAGASTELAPGGEHFMLMGVSEPVMAGDEVALTVTLSDGTSVDLGSVPARTMGAGAEGYDDMGDTSGMASMSGMAGMDHSGHGDHSGHDHGHGADGASTEPSAAH